MKPYLLRTLDSFNQNKILREYFLSILIFILKIHDHFQQRGSKILKRTTIALA